MDTKKSINVFKMKKKPADYSWNNNFLAIC